MGRGDQISIHAPRVGSDQGHHAGGKTAGISIHAPRVGSDGAVHLVDVVLLISIHAPRVGSDPVFHKRLLKVKIFQSTLPVWGATRVYNAVIGKHGVFQSTLPVWGATRSTFPLCIAVSHFNPRSPCGERLYNFSVGAQTRIFQSTLPVWGATGRTGGHHDAVCISIHAPRVGSDTSVVFHLGLVQNFNPRSPCGERPPILFNFDFPF